jgi:hypothetical protein
MANFFLFPYLFILIDTPPQRPLTFLLLGIPEEND